MYGSGVGSIDLPALRGNPFDNRPIESSRAQDLVGRKEILHRWREHIHSGSPRMILLVGEPGSGRTSMINAISSQTPKKYIGQFLSEEGDQTKVMLHEILTHFGSFQSITTMNQLSQNLISLFDEDKGPLPIIALDYPPQIININSFLSRVCPVLSRLRAMVIVSLSESQYLELDDGIRNLFDEPDRLENFSKIEIQEMINNRIRLKSKERWVINSMILNSIYERTGGNPRSVIRILKCLVDEERNLGYQGTLESLMSLQTQNKSMSEDIDYIGNKIVESNNSEDEISFPEIIEPNLENDDFIDEEPSDLWDFEEEESPLSDPHSIEENNRDIAEEKLQWSENFPETNDDFIDYEEIIPEEDDRINLLTSRDYNEIKTETELFMSPGTEPPESLLDFTNDSKNKGLKFLRKRLQKTTSDMKNEIMPEVPITYADEKPPQSTLENYVNEEIPEIENEDKSVETMLTEARMDQNIQSTDYEEVISIEGAEWSVEPSFHSTIPETISKPPAQNDYLTNFEEGYIEQPISKEIEIEESVFEDLAPIELVDSIPIYQDQSNENVTNNYIIKSKFSPSWEEDQELDVNRFYSLSDAERMILEAASIREISPSDDELQARLEVGRPRLSQLYNSLHKSGMLSVRKQGRTRLFKLSVAASKEF